MKRAAQPTKSNGLTRKQRNEAHSIGKLLATQFGTQEVFSIILEGLDRHKKLKRLKLPILAGACEAQKGLVSTFGTWLLVQRAQAHCDQNPGQDSDFLLIGARSLQAGVIGEPPAHEGMLRARSAQEEVPTGIIDKMGEVRDDVCRRMEALVASVGMV